MGRHAELVRALAMRAKGAKERADGAALGDQRLKELGRQREAAARRAEAEARAARRRSGH
ncbi:hypothetical protein [Streptomyces sp. NPDC096323]|uniref:hypothetical protein n=1 Tax=Streptomyces sp. NPDC096323 TaxID=3155822 RepID=UPI00331FFB34